MSNCGIVWIIINHNIVFFENLGRCRYWLTSKTCITDRKLKNVELCARLRAPGRTNEQTRLQKRDSIKAVAAALFVACTLHATRPHERSCCRVCTPTLNARRLLVGWPLYSPFSQISRQDCLLRKTTRFKRERHKRKGKRRLYSNDATINHTRHQQPQRGRRRIPPKRTLCLLHTLQDRASYLHVWSETPTRITTAATTTTRQTRHQFQSLWLL